MSTLKLNVSSAVLNKSTEMFGKMENYVVVKALVFGQIREYRTSIVEGDAKNKDKDNRIVWNETLNIDMPQQAVGGSQLEVLVMDEDMGKDEVCAQGVINAHHCGFYTGGTNNYVLNLYDGKKPEKAGELSFSVTYV